MLKINFSKAASTGSFFYEIISDNLTPPHLYFAIFANLKVIDGDHSIK